MQDKIIGHLFCYCSCCNCLFNYLCLATLTVKRYILCHIFPPISLGSECKRKARLIMHDRKALMQQQSHTFVEIGHDEAGSIPALPARNSYSAERLSAG